MKSSTFYISNVCMSRMQQSSATSGSLFYRKLHSAPGNTRTSIPFSIVLDVACDPSQRGSPNHTQFSEYCENSQPSLNSPSKTMAPQLCSLFLGCEKGAYLDYAAYIEMLKSRLKAENCALQTAVLATKGSGPSDVIVQQLNTLRRPGFELSLVAGEEANDAVRRRNFDTTWT
ncbi:hypothetical protein DFH06DRAFT_337734 [Mycena polygramma]|nr:hypothetical protein DFH06DRAFT_337734 [Mycena polygramma]